ncbi:hypothetical protein [Flavisolibacter tropicus]|uniref:Tetratricopeptide repeat protein n=1 Tax=Flavisolibacter tropicus TaxID=1492898 RepID=A0A172TQX2_9BACT|nr:hypothetical protein [Flavisolibacter tropicus]ANE49382.1 hypothetical protein SY85_01550 [Flavisolibacter tropicus]
MANSLAQLAHSIFKKSIDDCSLDELSNFSKRYPYFGPAQFLYLKKLDPNSEEYQRQYQKAVLFYHDPVLFHQFIDEKAFQTPFNLEISEEQKVENEGPATPVTPNLTELKNAFKLPSLKDPMPSGAENIITFEPFHTVDYFASQGIKLSLEESSKDKFGKQLKSFTEWLKTMKRLPATQMNKIQGTAEKQVENMAAHSIQSSEIVTEAMAEVWVRQGNKAKAIEIYRKLSLLNPSKNSYFASKIELLNDSN